MITVLLLLLAFVLGRSLGRSEMRPFRTLCYSYRALATKLIANADPESEEAWLWKKLDEIERELGHKFN